ncbi:MAG: hypothetical protein U0X20_05260 [Caldilineaceae bacterium]
MKQMLDRLVHSTQRRWTIWLYLLMVVCLLVGPAPAALAQSSGDDVPIVPAQTEEAEQVDAVRTEPPGPGVSDPVVTPGLVELTGSAAQPQHPIDPATIEKLNPIYLPLLSLAPDQVQASAAQAAKSIDMKLLVIAADGNETDYPYIRATLDQLGIPYDVLLAATTPLTADKLSDGADHGYYQGIILVTGGLIFYDAGSNTWPSALDTTEWNTLWVYEAAFGVRQVTSYTVPGSYPDSYGMSFVTSQDTTNQPLTATFTPAGSQVYADINTSSPVTITNAWVYFGTVVDPAVTTPLLVTSQGYPVASITTYPDGRQNLAITAANNTFLIHSLQLAYGTINWLTKGLFLGYRKTWINTQVDDLFIESDMWDTTAMTDTTGHTFRLSGTDFAKAVLWQNNVQAKYPLASSLTLEWAYNGEGVLGIFRGDTLTPIVRLSQGQFSYVNHTYSHLNLDAPTTYQQALTELQQNAQTATNFRFTHYFKDALVQPDISGLDNSEFQRAAVAFGTKYLISDTSRSAWNNPSPNAGFYSTYQPSILIIPRRPSNLFYNLATPAQWVSEYNCYYGPTGTCAGGAFRYWSKDLTYAEILDKESNVWLQYLLKWDIDPLMFHQANVRSYPSTSQYPNTNLGYKSLLGDLIEATLAKYSRLSKLPIQFITQHNIGAKMAERMAYNTSGVTATFIPCDSLTLRAAKAARIPITGLTYGAAADHEVYGGQNISYVSLAAGQSLTIPLPACN